MTKLHALTALTHATTQLFYKWLEPPDPIAIHGASLSSCQTSDLGAWTRSDWLALLAEVKEQPHLLPWLERLSSQTEKVEMIVDLLMKHLREVARAEAKYLTIHHQDYPSMLRSIADPPLALTLLGDLHLLERPAISIVGSRKASALALQKSFALGRDLALAGGLVVSGGALGCDVAAHQGVLATRLIPSPALCVFAGGLRELYPKANDWVFRQLIDKNALLVSERFWWATSRPMDFPVRNRIIAGLSGITLVMQATERSGALITARQALDQGREVAVLVHPKDDVRAIGSAALIADGAGFFRSDGVPDVLSPYLGL